MYLILIYYCYLFLPIFTFLSVLVNQDFGYRAILVTLLWAVPLAYAGLVYPYNIYVPGGILVAVYKYFSLY